MIVAVLHAQRQRGAGLPATVRKDLRVELLGQEFVGAALIDEDRPLETALRHQDARVVLAQDSRSAPR